MAATLILGGVSSGKSVFAEKLVQDTGWPKTYIATAQAWDDEMRTKVADHQARRGEDWHTLEAPLDVAAALKGVQADHAVLLDCVTLWLTNMMMAEQDIERAVDELAATLQDMQSPVFVVSNEVGLGGIAENKMARRFQKLQGAANQKLAEASGTVVLITAGLPMALKGQL